jgi:hypothetical protein
MKLRYPFILAVLCLSAAWAQAQNTRDFLGTYDVLTPGATATLELRPTVDQNGERHAQMTLCIGTQRSGCPSYTLHDQVVNGQLLLEDKGRTAPIPGWIVKATTLQSGREIAVSMDSGIDLLFRQR